MTVQQPVPGQNPPGRRERTPGHGLDGAPCPERERLAQGTPAGMLPCTRMCSRCGRITARRDEQGRPWCGGEAQTSEGSGR